MPDLAIDSGVIKLQVAIENSKAVEGDYLKLINSLQEKSKLSITIDISEAQSTIERLRDAVNDVQTQANTRRRSGGTRSSQQDRERNRIIERYADIIDVAQRKLAQGFAVPGVRDAINDLSRLLDQYRATGEGANALKVAASTLSAALNKEASIEKYADAIDIAQQKVAQGFNTPSVQDAINNLRQLLDQYRATGEGANALKVAAEQLDAALRAEAAAAKRANKEANKPAREAQQATRSSASQAEALERRLNAFENAAQRMRLRLNDLGDGKTTAEYERFVALLDSVRKNGGQGFEQLASASIDAQHSIQALNKELQESQRLQQSRESLQATLTHQWFTNQKNLLTKQLINADPTAIANAQAALENVERFGDVSKLTTEQINELNAALAEYRRRVAEVRASDTHIKSIQDEATAISNLKAQYEDYMSKYGQNLQRNLPLLEKFRKLGSDLASGAITSEAARKQFATLRAEAKQSGVEIETVRQRMTHLFGQHFNTALIMLAIRGLRMALRQLWQDIKEVNEALVQTQIVTGLTGSALKEYTDKAYEAADKSKDKVTNILSEATAFGRLGYDSELSVQLAQLTSMYSKLGDVDTSDATDAITALMKAFDLKSADEIELALDKMIYVGNNFPISAAGLGEGLNNAASALSSAGNSLEQTLALLMAANATVQNPSKSSTAMRTITARIRNTKAELDELGEELDEKYNTVAKYREQLKGLTGVDILDSAGKEFRSTYDILSDLAGMWENLDSTTQAAVTTMLAGTKQQDIFASLMKNFPSAQEAMAGMGDAAGLMDEKFKAVEDSISGALSGLSNAWSEFSNQLLNSGDITILVKMITGMVKALTGLTKVFGGGTMITGVLSLITLINKFRQFSQIYPQMQATLNALGANSPFKSVSYASLTQTEIEDIASALSGYTNQQQRFLMTQAGMSVAAQKQVLEYQGMSTAALSASGATSTLAASVDGLKAKMTAFVQSGNAWIMVLQAAIMLITFGINKYRQLEQAQAQVAENARQAKQDAISAARSVLDESESQSNSIESYQQKIDDIQKRLSDNAAGSEEYKQAQIDLYNVEQDIVNIFGEQAGAVRTATESLGDYASRLGDIADKSKYLSLITPENLSKTNSALSLFGVNYDGSMATNSKSLAKIKLNDVASVVYEYTTFLDRASQRTQAAVDLFDDVFGAAGSPMENVWRQNVFNTKVTGYSSQQLKGTYPLSWRRDPIGFYYHPARDIMDITEFEVSTTGLSAAKIVDLLEQQVQYWKDADRIDLVNIVSATLSQYKQETGYNDAKPVYDAWAEGYLRYDSNIKDDYNSAIELLRGADLAEAAGDFEVAAEHTAEALALLQAALNSADKTWIIEYLKDKIGGVQPRLQSNALKNDLNSALSNGHDYITHQEDDGTDRIFRLNREALSNTNAELIKYAGLLGEVEAANKGLGQEYELFKDLTLIANAYGVELETVLKNLINIGALAAKPRGEMQFSTFHNNAGSGLDIESPFTSASVSDATGAVASIKEASDKLFNAEAVRDRIKEAFDSGAEIAQEDIDAIKEYVGDTFDEVNEEALASIDETLDESRDEISTSIEGLANNAIQWMQNTVEGFNIADYIDVESGDIDFSGIMAAFQNSGVENAAGAAGANASMAYLSALQTVGGAYIRAKLTGDGLGFTTEFGNGGASDGGGKKGGGGGGGKKSEISDDIENVERLIKLFKELLNYYDEGSEQWIARQRQIIDKYKAGAEIAMAEYDRLIKKGLKQTDDDVKKIVDTILEYQGDIFDESKKLWDAVRQNQIDSLKHTKDQIDATIELEKTHHDLLVAIRDERRELEDELKAARDAYSEVMTPEELDALFSSEDYAELMDKLAGIEGDAMALYRDYKEQIAAVSEDETYMIEHITDEFKRQYDLKMKEYEIAKAELGVARAQQQLENVRNEQTVMMLIDGRWQWVADPEKVLEAEQELADAEQELADAQDEYDFQTLIHEMEAQSSGVQQQIDALEALTFSMDELAEQIHLFSDSVYKDLLTYLSKIAQETFEQYDGDTAIPQFETGGTTRRGGLAMLHPNETIFNSTDAAKLWSLVHNLDIPVSLDGVLGSFTRKLVSTSPVENKTAQPTMIDNSINIPGGIHVQGETAQQLIALLKSVVAPYQP